MTKHRARNRTLWRAWWNNPDKGVSSALLEAIVDREVTMEVTFVFVFFLAAYGAAVGGLVHVLVRNEGDPRLATLALSFMGRGAAFGAGMALIARGIAGDRLTWRRWLSWFSGVRNKSDLDAFFMFDASEDEWPGNLLGLITGWVFLAPLFLMLLAGRLIRFAFKFSIGRLIFIMILCWNFGLIFSAFERIAIWLDAVPLVRASLRILLILACLIVFLLAMLVMAILGPKLFGMIRGLLQSASVIAEHELPSLEVSSMLGRGYRIMIPLVRRACTMILIFFNWLASRIGEIEWRSWFRQLLTSLRHPTVSTDGFSLGVFHLAWLVGLALSICGFGACYSAYYFKYSIGSLVISVCLSLWVFLFGLVIIYQTYHVATHEQCTPYRATCLWWLIRPTALEIEAALRREPLPQWQDTLEVLEKCRSEMIAYSSEERVTIGTCYGRQVPSQEHIPNGSWTREFVWDHLLCTQGGAWVREHFKDVPFRSSQVSIRELANIRWRLRSIAQHSAMTIATHIRDWICTKCVARCRPHRVRISWWESHIVYGCHQCMETMSLHYCPGPIVVAIGPGPSGVDRSIGDIHYPNGDVAVILKADPEVSWFLENISDLTKEIQSDPIFFDHLDIDGPASDTVNAGLSDVVDRFLVHVAGDEDDYRRRYSQQATWWITPGCRLRENTLRQLAIALHGGPAERGGSSS